MDWKIAYELAIALHYPKTLERQPGTVQSFLKSTEEKAAAEEATVIVRRYLESEAGKDPSTAARITGTLIEKRTTGNKTTKRAISLPALPRK